MVLAHDIEGLCFQDELLYKYNSSLGDDLSVFNRLRMLRAERSVSRQQVADAVGVNVQTIGYLERGEYSPSLELALKLSGFFRLPIEAIFSTTPFAPLDARQLTATKDA